MILVSTVFCQKTKIYNFKKTLSGCETNMMYI